MHDPGTVPLRPHARHSGRVRMPHARHACPAIVTDRLRRTVGGGEADRLGSEAHVIEVVVRAA